MITLFPDQERSVAGLRASIRRQLDEAAGAASLLVSPTGSGKTVMFSYLTGRLTVAGKRVLLMAHREELLDQISRTLRNFGVAHGVLGKGGYYDPRLLAHVGNVFTLVKRMDRMATPDYIIVDEAHHGADGSTWDKVIAYFRALNPKLVVIGVTATPARLDGSGLPGFRDMVLGPTTRELIELGRLSKYSLCLPSAGGMVDLSGVRKRAGDYARDEATGRTDKPTITGSAVDQYRKHCDGAPAVVFCGSREHAEHVAEHFRSNGYRAAAIDGTMKDRGERVRDFGTNQIQVLTSCDLISEGFDVPGIVAAILLRPTQSLALYLQQVGRALRVAPGKERAVILDHVGNSMMPLPGGGYALNHGFPDDEREWSLEGCKRAKKDVDPDDVATKQCPKCREWNRALVSKCRNPDCGHVFVVKSRKIAERDGELEEVDVDALRTEARRQQGQAQDIESLQALGMSSGRANHILQARAEKAALQQRALDLSWELSRRTGGDRLTQYTVRPLKPKQLRDLIAALELELAATEPASDAA